MDDNGPCTRAPARFAPAGTRPVVQFHGPGAVSRARSRQGCRGIHRKLGHGAPGGKPFSNHAAPATAAGAARFRASDCRGNPQLFHLQGGTDPPGIAPSPQPGPDQSRHRPVLPGGLPCRSRCHRPQRERRTDRDRARKLHHHRLGRDVAPGRYLPVRMVATAAQAPDLPGPRPRPRRRCIAAAAKS